MTALDVHRAGDCRPETCPVCADTCKSCGERFGHCQCGTRPLRPNSGINCPDCEETT